MKFSHLRVVTIEIEVPYTLTVEPAIGEDARNPHCGPEIETKIESVLVHSLARTDAKSIRIDPKLSEELREFIEREICRDVEEFVSGK
jgi:hypothetical protein